MSWLKKLFTPGAKLTPDERRTSVLCGTTVALALFLVVILAGGRAAALKVGSDSSAWETAIQARIMAGRFVAAFGVWIAALLTGWGTFELLDNSKRGKWLFAWADGDSDLVKAAKTFGACLVLGMLLLASASLFGRVLG